ncbi:nucleoporin Nup186/Nup192/Nup205 [Phyllosticta citrichinensis]
MADNDSFGILQGLHRDLVALSELRLGNIDRLWAELESRIDEFKRLLDKPRRNDRSREALRANTLKIDEDEYEINDEFKQTTIRVADALDLDEIESAKICFAAQQDIIDLDRSLFAASVIRFHERRQFLLESWRLLLKSAADPDCVDQIRYGVYTRLVLGVEETGRLQNGHAYWQKCLASMGEIERWLQSVGESILAGAVVGKAATSEEMENLEYQRKSLTWQHQSLSAICTLLAKAGFISVDNFRVLLDTLKSLNKHDIIVVHYIPIVTAAIHQLFSAEGSASMDDAIRVHGTIVAGKDAPGWGLRNFHAAVMVWWLAEYSGRYIDPGPLPPRINLEAEAEQRSQLFLDALKDGAFHFMLATSQDVKPNRWYDPAKARLLSFLLQEAPSLPSDSIPITDYFRSLYAEQMQLYVDAFITNMPDPLRKLKVEEDDKRRQIHSRFQPGHMEQELHLERFLLIVSYAFAENPDAAQNFWSDTEGNLYGFLQWAAKRQTTPRTAAFCEMLRSLSEGEECATAAHRFLQEEGAVASGKLRRTSSLSYQHILSELSYYATSLKDKSAALTGSGYKQAALNTDDHLVEPETAMMLECHMRLLAHVFKESSEARNWILTQATINVVDTLLQLFTTISVDNRLSTESRRLRACIFSVLSSLLSGKTPQVGDALWSSLDHWIVYGAIPSGIAPRTLQPETPQRIFFETVNSDYDEATAFLNLLTALIAPYSEEASLTGTLPFPETLGSTYRRPGIDKYVDFAMERVFGAMCKRIEDPLQLHVLRWHCLNFISICLSTFNEDLVEFATKSNISVDDAINSSTLSVYVQLHPFARVMEWLFNDSVIDCLFAAAHQDAAKVNDATADSPLLMSVVKAVQVLDQIMKLQSTYLSIVRREKTQTSNQRRVANTALTSFDDAILNHLSIIVDLGLYCGTGHQDLTILSLDLLRELSSSPKLVVSPTAGFGSRSDRSKMIGIMEKDGDSYRIAKALIAEMELDIREFEVGPVAPGYVIKNGILDFLNECLKALPNRPTVAHLLLGFDCGSSNLDVADGGLFASGNALFHAILRLSVEYPEMIDDSFVPWSSTIKQKCIEILMKLWRSPLSSGFVMAELRASDFFTNQMLGQHLVDGNTLFAGTTISDPDFIFGDFAVALEKFFQQRTASYEYTARELRLVGDLPTSRARMQSTLLGVTVLSDGTQIQNPNVFDLFDFMELGVADDFDFPLQPMLGNLDLKPCQKDAGNPKSIKGTSSPIVDPEYDMKSVQELITLQSTHLRRSGRLLGPAEEQQLLNEVETLQLYLTGMNQRRSIALAKRNVLKAWVQLMVVLIEKCEFDETSKSSFILQALQVILPKLEKAYTEDLPTAIELADLARALLTNVDFQSADMQAKSKAGDMTKDRLLQLFRVALDGTYCSVTSPELREICYQICYRYIRGTATEKTKTATNGALDRSFSGSLAMPMATSKALTPTGPKLATLNGHTMRVVKSAGNKLIDVVCDDAYAGQGTCRVSALLFLESLVSLATREDSRYILDSLVRLNFVDVLVDSIKVIPNEIQSAKSADIPLLLSFIDACLSVLLRISQTRLGAAHIFNAGLFNSVRESKIFSTDPDFGFGTDNLSNKQWQQKRQQKHTANTSNRSTEIDNANALSKFFDLMLSVLRVVNSVVITRGPQNEACRETGRQFIIENRPSIVSIFKRQAGVGGYGGVAKGKAAEAMQAQLDELAENLCVLIHVTGFVEWEEEHDEKPRALAFS